jgi:hypothetical protein
MNVDRFVAAGAAAGDGDVRPEGQAEDDGAAGEGRSGKRGVQRVQRVELAIRSGEVLAEAGTFYRNRSDRFSQVAQLGGRTGVRVTPALNGGLVTDDTDRRRQTQGQR